MHYSLILVFFFLVSCGEKSDPSKIETPKLAETTSNEKRIIFFGDSLTAGLGLNDFESGWPHLLVNRMRKDGFFYQITNAGVSGDTTSGGLGRIDWVLSQKPDIFVLELGANDMLRGINPQITRQNLSAMIRKVKSEYPECKILLIGMRATPNLGKAYSNQFDTIYTDLAKEENLILVPFLLEKVAGKRKLNQKDGIHPTEEGHRLLAETVYPYFRKLVK